MMQNSFPYMADRVDDQIKYFDSSAIKNQRRYRFIKSTSIICNVLTTMAIALAFTVSGSQRLYVSIAALVLSTIVLATYQWEEFHNYGAKWEKFRLVAEQLKSEKHLFINRAGLYSVADSETRSRIFVEAIEKIIRGTDIAYFTLMVEPGRRIERRLENLGQINTEGIDADSEDV